jgi:hypothetical protein
MQRTKHIYISHDHNAGQTHRIKTVTDPLKIPTFQILYFLEYPTQFFPPKDCAQNSRITKLVKTRLPHDEGEGRGGDERASIRALV